MKNVYLFCFVAGLTAIPAFAETAGIAGVANFHQVNETLYRGALPTDEGLKNLAGLGVKTIVDLLPAKERSQTEEKSAERLGMRYINVPMTGLTAPTDDQIQNLLAVLTAADSGPVFVHCREGKDRTGAVIACYRIAHDHWDNAQALEEAKSLGMHFFQHPRQNYILKFHPNSGIQSSTDAVPGSASADVLPVA
jgi:tyrosine-protein phosphatase SIW14